MQRNWRIHDPIGDDYIYPIATPAIPHFEVLTEMQVNIFFPVIKKQRFLWLYRNLFFLIVQRKKQAFKKTS